MNEHDKRVELSKEDMLFYLNELNERLASVDKQGEILLTGGAAMALVFNARDTTGDMDALFYPTDDLRKIISDMATKYSKQGLESDWLNDAVSIYVTEKINFVPFMELSNLTIKSVDAESLLAMKLTAARRHTSKDMDDSIFLMKHLNIKTEEELFKIVDNHVDYFLRPQRSKFFVKEAFEKYSIEVGLKKA